MSYTTPYSLTSDILMTSYRLVVVTDVSTRIALLARLAELKADAREWQARARRMAA